MIHQSGDFGIRIYINKAAAKLIAITNPDDPGIILGISNPQSQEFLQQDGDLHTVGRAERIELQRMLANW